MTIVANMAACKPQDWVVTLFVTKCDRSATTEILNKFFIALIPDSRY
jgi:hypothetical protein